MSGKISFRVKSDFRGIWVRAYKGRSRIGALEATWQISARECQAHVDKLQAQYPEAERILSVWKVEVLDPHRGQGIGKAMYETAMAHGFKQKGAFLFVPTKCRLGPGSTSPDAQRVWISLGSKYPSSGHVVAVVRPVTPSVPRITASNRRVASRYLKANASQFLQNFQKYWVDLQEAISEVFARIAITPESYLDGNARGVYSEEHYGRALRRSKYLLRSVSKVSWRRMATAAYAWITHIMEERVIPKGKAKKLELAARPFLQNPPRKVVQWAAKNEKNYEFLVSAAKWKLKEDVEESDTVKVGPFTVHDTVHLDPPALKKTLGMLQRALKHMQASRIPGFSKALYGNVIIAGRLQSPRTMAWYYVREDNIYIRPHLKFGLGEIHNFIHEVGHRFWKKFLSRDVRSAWHTRHFVMARSGVDYASIKKEPDIGEPLPIKGMKRGGPPVVVKVEGQWVHLVHEHTGRDAKISLNSYRSYQEASAKRAKFPTPYSSTDSEEHFCEALAMYLMGTLPEPHKSAFEQIIVEQRGLS